jgi:hypothetical protein
MKKTSLPRCRLLSVAAAHWLALLACAGLPEPDNLVYGTIAFNGKPVTSTNTHIRVEARRALAGPAVAAYRMGSSHEAGEYYYVLKLPLEAPPALLERTSQLGDKLFIVVLDGSIVLAQRGFQIAEWAGVARLDFGASVDTDGNGIPDGWEELHGAGAGDADGDGMNSLAEYVAGTRPDLNSSAFNVTVERTPSLPYAQVYFLALRSDGLGYEGRTRYYALEQSTTLSIGGWEAVSNYSRILGNGQWVVYMPCWSNPPTFYRARVWLEGP